MKALEVATHAGVSLKNILLAADFSEVPEAASVLAAREGNSALPRDRTAGRYSRRRDEPNHWRAVLWIAALLLPISVSAAQQTSAKKAESRGKSMASGKTLFMQHCASCHGDDAKGAGPAALALKKQPPDLTGLAKRNHGKFPYQEVSKAIDGDFEVPAHGSREMPTWGPLFLALTDLNAQEAERLTTQLTDYIRSLQVR
jgi:mono/diheme cytochrome c family protein